MKKINKVETIALASIVTAGAAVGITGMSTNAEDLENKSVNVEDSDQNSVSSAEKAATDYYQAKSGAEKAQADSDKATAEKETAINEAKEAFVKEKESAKDADKQADKSVSEAEDEKGLAEESKTGAEAEKANAEDSYNEALKNETEVKAESSVTEKDVLEKEDEVVVADSEVNKALDAKENAEAELASAEKNVKEAETAEEQARFNAGTAKSNDEVAQENVNATKSDYDKASESLKSAENMRNNDGDITNTSQYKDVKEAERNYNDTVNKATEAENELKDAENILMDTESTATAAETVVDKAKEILKTVENALENAITDKQNADNELSDAEATYNQTKSDADHAKDKTKSAEENKNSASILVSDAESVKNAAVIELENAVKNASDAETNAVNALDNKINNATKEVGEKQTFVDSMKERLDSVQEKVNQGMIGFIDWMLSKDNLTDLARSDLERAKKNLVDKTEENLSQFDDRASGITKTGKALDIDVYGYGRNGKTIVIGDPRDATSLSNVRESINVMYKINELRSTDELFTDKMSPNEATTNFDIMVKSQVAAMRASAVLNHPGTSASAECLAFGYSDPTKGWYDYEKKYFIEAMKELGYEKITTRKEMDAVVEKALANNHEVRHYTNLLCISDQSMGCAYTQYAGTSTWSPSTWSYDAFVKSKYIERQEYTIAEFEALFNEYYASIDETNLQEAYSIAVEELNSAQANLDNLKANRDNVIKSAINDAEEIVNQKRNAVLKAEENLNKAKDAENKAVEEYAQAITGQKDAETALNKATIILNEAKENAEMAAIKVTDATTTRDQAKINVDNAVLALKDAVNNKEVAKTVVEEKTTLAIKAKNAVATAKERYDKAEEALAILTSDDTIQKLQAEKDKTEAALQEALNKKAATEQALAEAIEELGEATENVNKARAELENANKVYEDASKNYDAKISKAVEVANELSTLRDQFKKVSDAIAERVAAENALAQANTKLDNANTRLEVANNALETALANKSITADKLARAEALSYEDAFVNQIEDKDFAYLNDLIRAVKEAEDNVAIAEANLAVAQKNLDEKKAINDEWIERTRREEAIKKAAEEMEASRNRENLKGTLGTLTERAREIANTLGDRAIIKLDPIVNDPSHVMSSKDIREIKDFDNRKAIVYRNITTTPTKKYENTVKYTPAIMTENTNTSNVTSTEPVTANIVPEITENEMPKTNNPVRGVGADQSKIGAVESNTHAGAWAGVILAIGAATAGAGIGINRKRKNR